ncbi:MAG: hypothetical protein QM734_17460 [Cyclobacteriaceae bacterium]
MIISTSQDPNLAQVLRTCDGMRADLCSNETLLAIIGSFTNAQGGKHPLIQAAVFSPLACSLDVRGLYLSSMSSKYKFHDPDGCYFVTFAVVGWIALFTRDVYKNIVVDSCTANKTKVSLYMHT